MASNLLFTLIFSLTLIQTGLASLDLASYSLHSSVESRLLTKAFEKLDAIAKNNVDLEEEKERSLVLPSKPIARHLADLSDSSLFSAYLTSSVSNAGAITGWTLDYEVQLSGSNFNTGTGIFTAPNTGTNYYYISASFNCRADSACAITFRYAVAGGTATIVAGMANRDDPSFSPDAQDGQMSQVLLIQMAASSTIFLSEEAGGGNPARVKFSDGNRYSTFQGFLITTSIA